MNGHLMKVAVLQMKNMTDLILEDTHSTLSLKLAESAQNLSRNSVVSMECATAVANNDPGGGGGSSSTLANAA